MGKDHAMIRPAPHVKKALKGILKGKSSIKKALLQEHRFEVQRDKTGTGDYTKERRLWLNDIDMESILVELNERRKKKPK